MSIGCRLFLFSLLFRDDANEVHVRRKNNGQITCPRTELLSMANTVGADNVYLCCVYSKQICLALKVLISDKMRWEEENVQLSYFMLKWQQIHGMMRQIVMFFFCDFKKTLTASFYSEQFYQNRSLFAV